RRSGRRGDRAPARRGCAGGRRGDRTAPRRGPRALLLRPRGGWRRAHEPAPAPVDDVVLGAARARAGALRDPRIAMARVQLHRLAHGRTGDKGDRSNISVIAYRPEFFPLLVEQVTEARVAEA